MVILRTNSEMYFTHFVALIKVDGMESRRSGSGGNGSGQIGVEEMGLDEI